MNESLRIAPTIDEPERPQVFNPSVTAVNHNSGKTVATVRHLTAYTDEPAEKGGEDTAPTPLETALLSLVGCEGVIIKGVAKAMRFDLERTEFDCKASSDLRGARGVKGVRPHFETVDLQIRVYSNETAERMEKLRYNVERRCPVLNLFIDAGVSVNVEWTLLPASQESA